MNAEQHGAALRRIEELCAIDPALDTPEGKELDHLVTKVMAYEAEHFPFPQEAPPSALFGTSPVSAVAEALAARRTAESVLQIMAALDEFYTPLSAVRWFECPQQTLGGQRPIDLVVTTDGVDKVLAVIARLRDGAHV